MRRRNQKPATLLSRLLAATRLLGTFTLLVLGFALTTVVAVIEGSAAAGAQTTETADLEPCPDDLASVPVSTTSEVRIFIVSGLIDPVISQNIMSHLDKAEANPKVVAAVLQINSKGTVLDDRAFTELAARLRESRLQIALWVGQSGATAQGGAAELATVADIVAVTPNSTIGNTGPRRLPGEWGDPFGEASQRLQTTLFTAAEAIAADVSIGPLEDTVPIGSFETRLDGFEVFRCLGPDGLVTIPQTPTEFAGLTLTEQLLHSISSPELAYLFFVLGLGLLVFELFTAGIGIAGLTGAVFTIMGSYGLAFLPVRWWAVALLVLAVLFISIDVQTNVPRFYTILGLLCLTVGTFTLFDGVSLSYITIAAGLIGGALYAYTGMPSMVRTRFSTPTIGRKWMIGEIGEAITDVSPEGTVRIRGVAWQAITNRATPVKAGEPLVVIGIDRLLLEIAPEEGGARDYRDRS